jgi:hypothetical protein
MPNNFLAPREWDGIFSAGLRSRVGCNLSRRTRYDARVERRYGKWDILEIPTILLWTDDPYVVEEDDDVVYAEEEVIDLWG